MKSMLLLHLQTLTRVIRVVKVTEPHTAVTLSAIIEQETL